MQMAFERLLQSTGKTIYAMVTQGAGAVVNLILDPILIFGLFGFPAMGVAGAAAATVIGQIAAAVLAIVFNLRFNKELHITLKGFRPDKELIGNIYKVGIPSIVMQAIGSVMTYGMNLILEAYGVAQTVFGIYFKLQSFIFMPVFGLNNGMIPIIAYNYGARKRSRITQTIRLSVAISMSIMALGMIIFLTCPKLLLASLFNASDNMLAIGVPALKIISLHFLLAGYSIIISSTFQALGNGVYSLIVSAARQLFVILPIAYIFAKVAGLSAVWWSFPIAEFVSVLLCTLLFTRIYREKIKGLGN